MKVFLPFVLPFFLNRFKNYELPVINNKPFDIVFIFLKIKYNIMMLSKKVILASIIVAVITITLFALQVILSSSNAILTTNSKLNIQFTKEDMKRVGFGVVERIAAERLEKIIINDDGKGFYTMQQGSNTIQKEFTIDDDTLKRLRSLINDYGLLSVNINKESIDDEDGFLRYTLSITLDGNTKVIRWVERLNVDEMKPSDVPPLLIRVRDALLSIMSKAN